MRSNNRDGRYQDVLDGYYGCVIDHIGTTPEYYLAIEVTAENRLFYHIVKDDQIAMKILEKINSLELRGEVNFFPINRVVSRQRRDITDTAAESMLSKIEFDHQFDGVMRQLFAETVIVPNLEIGARVSRNERFNCVTPEGTHLNIDLILVDFRRSA